MKKKKKKKSLFSFHFQRRNQEIFVCACCLPLPCWFRPPEIHDLTIRNCFLAANDDIALFEGLIEIFSFFFIEYRPPIGTKMTRSMKGEEK